LLLVFRVHLLFCGRTYDLNPLALYFLLLVNGCLRFELQQYLEYELNVHINLHEKVLQLLSLERVELVRNSATSRLSFFRSLCLLLGGHLSIGTGAKLWKAVVVILAG
jgi:hypothetical protein